MRRLLRLHVEHVSELANGVAKNLPIISEETSRDTITRFATIARTLSVKSAMVRSPMGKQEFEYRVLRTSPKSSSAVVVRNADFVTNIRSIQNRTSV